MSYLNAEKGIKKVYLSQIIAIIAALLSGCAVVFSEILIHVTNHDSKTFAAVLLISIACFAAFLAAVTVTGMLGILGYYQASKDEPAFRKSMFCALVSAVLTVVGAFLQIPSEMLHTILTSAGTIVEMFVVVFAISAMIDISESLDRPDLCGKGEKLLKLMLVTYIISSIETLIIRIFELSDQAKNVSFIISAMDLILIVLRYVLYLRFLRDELKMLKNHRTEGLRG